MICAKLIFNQKSNSLHNEDVTPKSVRKSPCEKKLQKKGHRMDAYKSCTLCPRNCKIDRTQGKTGFCKETDQLRLAVACLHFGEEPPITVNNGSGTIFVTGCNLRCAFCQNYQISQCGMGKALNIEETVQIFFQLKEQGAENINIVTGSHAIPFFAKAIKQAKDAGLDLPICWNCSAYESVETLEMLKGLVDIWLPDLKTLNPMMSEAVFKAADYPAAAKKAIRWMIKNTKSRFITVKDKTDPTQTKEKMLSGVIIRHLVMPGRLDDTALTLDWLEKMTTLNPENTPCISLMMQYTPVSVDKSLFTAQELQQRETALAAFSNRLITKEEFQKAQELIQEHNFEYLFYQELEEDTEWLPDFTRPQPFSNELAKVVWHWTAK